MPKLKLTKSNIDKLEITGARVIYWDTDLLRFGMRVEATGQKYFLIQFRLRGAVRKMSIGTYGVMTVDQARGIARQKLAEVESGIDPMARKTVLELPTVAEILDGYIDKHCSQHVKPRTKQGYQGIRRRHFAKFLKLPADQVTKQDLTDYHLARKGTPREANGAIILWRSAWKWGQGYFTGLDELQDPSRFIRLYQRGKRERRFSGEEIGRIGLAMRQLVEEKKVSMSASLALLLCMMAGMRSDEVKKLKHKDLHLDARTAFLPDSKTGAKAVPLGDDALELLRAIVPSSDNEFVFHGHVKGRGFQSLQRPWERICKRAGLKDGRIHDLRHTYASQVDETQKKAMADALGHKTLAITDGYRHSSPAEVHHAANVAGGRIAALLNGVRLPE